MSQTENMMESQTTPGLEIVKGLMENLEHLNTLDMEKLSSIFNLIDYELNGKELNGLEKVDLERSNLQGLNNRRSEIEILAFILKAARKGVNKTSILYRANLSGRQMKNYLTFLTTGGFIKKDEEKSRGALLTTTPKGSLFLYHWTKILQLIEAAP